MPVPATGFRLCVAPREGYVGGRGFSPCVRIFTLPHLVGGLKLVGPHRHGLIVVGEDEGRLALLVALAADVPDEVAGKAVLLDLARAKLGEAMRHTSRDGLGAVHLGVGADEEHLVGSLVARHARTKGVDGGGVTSLVLELDGAEGHSSHGDARGRGCMPRGDTRAARGGEGSLGGTETEAARGSECVSGGGRDGKEQRELEHLWLVLSLSVITNFPFGCVV